MAGPGQQPAVSPPVEASDVGPKQLSDRRQVDLEVGKSNWPARVRTSRAGITIKLFVWAGISILKPLAQFCFEELNRARECPRLYLPSPVFQVVAFLLTFYF